MAARMRSSLAARWSAVIRMLLLVVGVRAGCVDGVQDAHCPVMVGLQSCPLGLAGRAEVAEEGLGLLGVLGPDGPVAGVVGGLVAAGGVAHSDEGLVGGGGPGEPEAERPGRVGEPALWRPGSYAA